MTFYQGDRDIERVITGSSNFTHSGFIDNLEFDVELKTVATTSFAVKSLMSYGMMRWMLAKDTSRQYRRRHGSVKISCRINSI
jgi:HKD family nuclease